jgi:hypothetical protein
MPNVEGWMRVTVWVPQRPDLPGGKPPDWGIEEGGPAEPGFPIPPEIGGGPILPGLPDIPVYPGQPLPRPPRPVYPIVSDPDDLGAHGDLPDLNHAYRARLSDGTAEYTGYITDPEPPPVEDDYEPRWPKRGHPGTWVAVVYRSALAWAWVPTPGTPEQGPVIPEREPR